jgi:hypothetical protein
LRRTALRSVGEVESLRPAPGDAGIEADFCPTILLHSCAVGTVARDSIEAALKARLYKPAKDRTSTVDRFNLGKHGWLFGLEG